MSEEISICRCAPLRKTGLVRGALCVGLAAATTLLVQPAMAANDSEDLSEVVVTGSRLSRSSFTSPNPLTVINAEQIENLGLVNVGEVVSQLPQNSNFFSPTNVGLGNFNVGAQLANLRGLNPFFGTRTLTLIDTRRVVPTTNGGGVDLSLIPSMLVGRSEVVTGGGSAMYGSDAVAGVVNIILDTRLTGFKAQADYGQSSRGDAKDSHLSAAFGTGFADGKGHVIIGAEYQDSGAIGRCTAVREWCADSYNQFTNVGYATNGQPHYIIGPDAKTAYASQTGVLIPQFGTGPAVVFNAAGTQATGFDPGQYVSGVNSFGSRQGGDGVRVGPYDNTAMKPSVERYTLLSHVTYDLTDSLQAFVEASFADSAAVNNYANGGGGPVAFVIDPPGVSIGTTIQPDNAYLPAGVSVGPFGAGFGRGLGDDIISFNETNNQTTRFLGGLSGRLAGSWAWDASYVYGRNVNEQQLHHAMVTSFFTGSAYDYFNWAVDAVHATPGDLTSPIVCRANAPAYGPVNPLAAGCVPINFFGIGNVTPEAADYAYRTLHEDFTYTQQVVSGNLRGDLFEGFGAGPIKAAVGGEYRWEKGNDTHDLANQPWYSGYFLSYGLDYRGKTSVAEAYAEVDVPLLKDLPFVKFLDLDTAIRFTKNKNTSETTGPTLGTSVTHDITNWKVSGLWDVTDWLRFRATRSRDARAASFRELYQTYAPRNGTVDNSANGGSTTDDYVGLTDTAVDLSPETADTTTIGFVLSPQSGVLSGFRLSSDWYQIKLSDAIASGPFGISAQQLVALCNSTGEFCDRIVGAGTPDVSQITIKSVNIGSYITRGVDMEADYNLPLSRFRDDFAGSLNFRVIASYLYDMLVQTTPTTPSINYAGQSGPTGAFGGFNSSPKWQANAFLTYARGGFTGTLQSRFIGSGRFLTIDGASGLPVIGPDSAAYNPTYIASINDNTVPSAFYYNLSASFDFSEHLNLFGRVDNLFDKKPAIAPGGNGFPTNPVYFDTVGMVWRVGVRLKF